MSIKHALVVDDSKSAQFALKKQLETHGLAAFGLAAGCSKSPTQSLADGMT